MEERKHSTKHFMPTALDGVQRSASFIARYIPEDASPGMCFITDWEGPRGAMEAVVIEVFFFHLITE
jgi:hypothetical protein